jgi:hypothetical protein
MNNRAFPFARFVPNVTLPPEFPVAGASFSFVLFEIIVRCEN